VPDFFDFDGDPIEYHEWIRLFFDGPGRQVANDYIGEGDDAVGISTVWMGLDYAFGHSTPLIYETMIFGGEHDHACWRTPNRHAALAAHDQAVALVRETRSAAR
jgi:hypothetical protein